MRNRRVFFSAPLQVWYTNPIGLRKGKNRKSRPLCALAVNFTSPVGIGPNWRLQTKARFEDYRWTQAPKVRLLGIKISIKSIAETILNKRKADIEQAIDNAVHKGLRLDKEVSKIWRDMQKTASDCQSARKHMAVAESHSVLPLHLFMAMKTRLQCPFRLRFGLIHG